VLGSVSKSGLDRRRFYSYMAWSALDINSWETNGYCWRN